MTPVSAGSLFQSLFLPGAVLAFSMVSIPVAFETQLKRTSGC